MAAHLPLRFPHSSTRLIAEWLSARRIARDAFGGLTRGATTSGDTSSDLSFGAAELLVALLTATWLAQGVRRRRLTIRAGATVVVALAMVCLATFSVVYAVDRPSAIKESLKWL